MYIIYIYIYIYNNKLCNLIKEFMKNLSGQTKPLNQIETN